MKKQIIDITKGNTEFWKQIEEVHQVALKSVKKPSLWQRIKSWF